MGPFGPATPDPRPVQLVANGQVLAAVVSDQQAQMTTSLNGLRGS